MRSLRLPSCDDADTAYAAAALLADADPPFRSALIVGAETRSFARELRRFLPLMSMQVHDRDATAEFGIVPLPFAEKQFDLVIGLDVMAARPASVRAGMVRELVRVSARETMVIEPLGTDLQLLIARSLINLYRDLFGTTPAELARHVDFGLPTPQEAFSWVRHEEDAELFYAGDVAAFQRAAEDLIRHVHQGWLRSLPGRLAKNAPGLFDESLREPESVPRRRHRRMFLLTRRI